MTAADALLRPTRLAEIPGLFAAFTTRRFAGPGEADDALRRLAEAEGFEGVASLRQVHSADVAHVTSGGLVPDHDGLVTATPGLLLRVLAADCVLVLLADPEARVAGACHSGWRGTVAGVAGRTVEAMEDLGARADRLHAYIGPCISAEAFEVGEEVAAQFSPRYVLRRPDWERPHVDLRAAVTAQLHQAGLPEASVEVSEACTLGEQDRFYSYRGEGQAAGRLFGLIGWRG
jgi:polyphenol oxidase